MNAGTAFLKGGVYVAQMFFSYCCPDIFSSCFSMFTDFLLLKTWCRDADSQGFQPKPFS